MVQKIYIKMHSVLCTNIHHGVTFLVNHGMIKGYLCYKTSFCRKIALYVQLSIFFIWRRNNVSFTRYVDFCVFMKSTNFKTWHRHRHCYTYFFWILSTIKKKFGQILVYCMKIISNMFLGLCWRLKTSFRPLFDFTKMTV